MASNTLTDDFIAIVKHTQIFICKYLNYFSATKTKENRKKTQASPSCFCLLKFCLLRKQLVWWQIVSMYLRNVQPEIWKSKTFPKSWSPNYPVKRFLLKPWQAPQCCRCCCSPSHSPFILSLSLQMSIWKTLLVIVRFQIHCPQKFFFSPPSIRVFPPKTESARRGLARAPRFSPAERAQAVPRRDQNNPRLVTASDPKTLLQNSLK